MKRFWLLCGLFTAGVLSLSCAALAQTFHHFTLNVGAALTTFTGTDAGKLDHGSNLQLNGGYFFNRYFGVTGNFMSSDVGITRGELNNLNQPDGAATVYGVTADPTLRLPLGRGFTAYVMAGGGSRVSPATPTQLLFQLPSESVGDLL